MSDSHRQHVDRLLEALTKDLFETRDEDLYRELREAGEEPVDVARHVRSLAAAAFAEVGLRRLAEARAQLDRVRSLRSQAPVTRLPLIEKDAILRQFAANDKPLQERLTMAARNGGSLSESEMNSVLLDLVELGAIDGDGHDR